MGLRTPVEEQRVGSARGTGCGPVTHTLSSVFIFFLVPKCRCTPPCRKSRFDLYTNEGGDYLDFHLERKELKPLEVLSLGVCVSGVGLMRFESATLSTSLGLSMVAFSGWLKNS